MARIPVISFLDEVRSETAKVTWPTRNHVIKMTIMVIIVSFLVSAYAFGLDLLFQQVMRVLLLQ
jgi:preprotein translocase subunit SecE